MNIKSSVFIICCVCFTTISMAQEKYKGTLSTKLGQDIQGEITINLQGENNELIEITSTEKTKSKGSKQTITTTSKLNIAIIKNIIINRTTYYFRDIKIGYDDKTLKNVCVQLIYGTIDCGLFKCGDGKGENNIAVKFPKAELHELASVDFDYYHSSITVPLQISDCKTLLNKMIEIDETVTWTNANSREDRIQRFKNIIDEYNNCKTN